MLHVGGQGHHAVRFTCDRYIGYYGLPACFLFCLAKKLSKTFKSDREGKKRGKRTNIDLYDLTAQGWLHTLDIVKNLIFE